MLFGVSIDVQRSEGKPDCQLLPTHERTGSDPLGADMDLREPHERYARCNFVAIAPQEPGGETT
jgi:hypothetical protein